MKSKSQDRSLAASLQRNKKKKMTILIVLLAILVCAVVAGIIVGLKIKDDNRIAKAKSVITQIDINSTFKTAEFPNDSDWDNDGVTNADEKRNKTNLQSDDTDNDGLSDGDEAKLGTDPLNADTDGDTLLDGYEVMAGLSPKLPQTDGKTDDQKRTMNVTKKSGDCTLAISGDANAASATLVKLDLFGIKSNASVISDAYDVYSDYDYNATITIKLNTNKMSKMGYTNDDLSILRFDSSTKTYSKVASTINNSKNTISAKITKHGTYVVGVEKTANATSTTRVCFLVDNSGSMYSKLKCATSTENDVNFKRLSFAQSLIDKFDKDYQIGISKFTGSYTQMVDFTTNRSELKSALNNIKTQDETFNGTHSQTALRNCLDEFTSTGSGKYRNIVVMLTDGESDETSPATLKQLTELADTKNVIVLTVGLGRDVDRDWLQELASTTGGKYYAASDANALNAVYKQIVTTLNYDIVSYNDSTDSVNGYSLYNTGFDPKVNGFSFKNFRTTTTTSVDFGMAVMARDWYIGNVKTSLGSIKPSDKSSQKVDAGGYDITDTKIGKTYENRKALGGVTSDLLSGTYSDVKKYLDYSSSGNVLKVKEDYQFDCLNKGWKVAKTAISGSNLQWNAVELLNLDIKDGIKKISTGYSDNEAEFAKALYRLNALQWDDSSSEFKLTNGDSGFEKLEQLLSLGVPVVTTIDGTHTVNAIGLIQDSDCHRKYILQIYDSNYPGQTKEVYIKKLPKCNVTVSGDKAKLDGTTFEYSATYEGKQVGISFSDVSEH